MTQGIVGLVAPLYMKIALPVKDTVQGLAPPTLAQTARAASNEPSKEQSDMTWGKAALADERCGGVSCRYGIFGHFDIWYMTMPLRLKNMDW